MPNERENYESIVKRGVKEERYGYNSLHQPFTKNHHITLQSIKREAIKVLKVVILAICFEGDITFVISE